MDFHVHLYVRMHEKRRMLEYYVQNIYVINFIICGLSVHVVEDVCAARQFHRQETVLESQTHALICLAPGRKQLPCILVKSS